MQIFLGLKKKLVKIYDSVKKNKFVLVFFIKPLNTFFLSNSPYKIANIKDSRIWCDQKIYKIDLYKEISNHKYSYELLNYILKETDKSDKILDICCNQGRFLKALHKTGYRSLLGVDIMKDAILSLQNSDEYQIGGISVEINLAQEYLKKLDKESIDYSITFTATIEHFHPGFNLFKELYRISRKGFIFIINENGHKYPRFYRYLISENNFKIKKLITFQQDITLIHAIK